MNDKQVAISVKDLHKEFVIPQNKNSSFKQTVVNIVKENKKVKQKVLNGVSFEINKGDFFGIVGRNGSGKSTLLKILAGVYAPTSGEVHINGNLTPFIELGVGFNPELSGRDNVYLNGALLGFSRRQMDSMYKEIVEFAELESFMGQKLKNYSSGMQVRLAFSIAIKAKGDILIFDEVLAVGDEAFQRKCLDVFDQYKASGQTVILVSHDMNTVKQYCNRAILVHGGKIIEDSDAIKVANQYSDLNQKEIDKETRSKNNQSLSTLKIRTLDSRGNSKVSYQAGDTMSVSVDCSRVSHTIDSIGINIFKQTGEHITGINTLKDNVKVNSSKKIFADITLPLQSGRYYIFVEVFRKIGRVVASNENQLIYFNITNSEIKWSGIVELTHKWKT